MLRCQIEKKKLDLKYTWKISRNASDSKTNLFVKVSDNLYEGLGEAAPNVRYNETPDSLEKQFETFQSLSLVDIPSIAHLEEKLKTLSLSNSLRFAIESAYVDYLTKKKASSIYNLLGVSPPQEIFTAYSIPIMEIGEIKKFYLENNLSRFRFIKVKVNYESGLETLQHISRFISQPMIVDANESWTDVEQLIYFLEKIKKNRVEFIEQPMPAALTDESVYLKQYTPFRLFGDESVTDTADFSLLKRMFDGVNIKLMKAGGYLNGIRLLKEAKANNMQTMIGCMVETTVGISAGMHLCSLADYVDLDSFLLIKNESFNLVKEMNGELAFE